MINNDIIWIAWEIQRRSIGLAKKLDVKLIIFDKFPNFRFLRYFHATIFTICSIISNKAKIIIVQNPSIVLAIVVIFLKNFLNIKVIVDRHTNFMLNRKKNIMYYLFIFASNYTIKHADLTIVTNDLLKNRISTINKNILVLQDGLPDLKPTGLIKLKGIMNVVYICSFDLDEPVNEAIEAFGNLKNVHFYITGNYRRSALSISSIENQNENIHFTGFLKENEYVNLLASADAILVLTKSEMTLNCGAYEAVSLGKPMILSNTETIKNYFTSGAVYCEPNDKSIEHAINTCFENIETIKSQSVGLGFQLASNWNINFFKLKQIINDFLGSTVDSKGEL